MASINRAKEIVDNHSTEEILEWVEKNLRNGLRAINSSDSKEDSFILGQCSTNIREILYMIEALNEKLKPKSPVVA